MVVTPGRPPKHPSCGLLKAVVLPLHAVMQHAQHLFHLCISRVSPPTHCTPPYPPHTRRTLLPPPPTHPPTHAPPTQTRALHPAYPPNPP